MRWEHATVWTAIRDFGPGPWWIAHEHPERPHDRWVVWCWTCDSCMAHLQVAATLSPDSYDAGSATVDGDIRRDITIAETWGEAMRWRQLNGVGP